MRMDEIVLYPDRSEDISKYNQYFDSRAGGIPAFDDLVYYNYVNNESEYHALFSKDSLVSITHVDIRDHGLWQITYAQTESSFKGKGCFRFLLTQISKNKSIVLSDDHHTPEAMRAWKSLIEFPGPDIAVWVYDVSSGQKQAADKITSEEIWNNKDVPVLAVTPKSRTVSTRDSTMNKLSENIQINRTENQIWFGANSSTNNYWNP